MPLNVFEFVLYDLLGVAVFLSLLTCYVLFHRPFLKMVPGPRPRNKGSYTLNQLQYHQSLHSLIQALNWWGRKMVRIVGEKRAREKKNR